METNKKILLVDDHDLVRFGTSLLLESLEEVKCAITPCRSLDEARTACRESGETFTRCCSTGRRASSNAPTAGAR